MTNYYQQVHLMKNNVNINATNIYYNYNDATGINYWHTQDSQQP